MECELPFMRLWVRDFMADPDVQEMNVDELGAYFRLLLVAWEKGAVPADTKRQARLLKVSPRRLERLWEVIGPKWESDGNGGLVNPRQERERQAALEAYRRRAEAGRKGGQSKAKATG